MRYAGKSKMERLSTAVLEETVEEDSHGLLLVPTFKRCCKVENKIDD